MAGACIEDYQWLVSAAGCVWMDRIAAAHESLVNLTVSLRRELPPVRVHLLLEQRELRARGRVKFAAAERMFFTRRSLEQATDQHLARYKSWRFGRAARVADLCCGIGGDLLALAACGPAVGVDRDPLMTLLAEANAASLGASQATVRTGDASRVDLCEFDAWHIDPDRRSTGGRISQPQFAEPSWETIERMLAARPNAAIKLAPAADLANVDLSHLERQWLGSRRECRQQVVWSGALARHPGQRSVAVVNEDPTAPAELMATSCDPVPSCTAAQRYVHAPHAAVRAARLVTELAHQYDLALLDPRCPYLTSDQVIDTPLADTFVVIADLAFDRRRLRAVLKARDLNAVEIKKHGAEIVPEKLRRQLRGTGATPATLLITRRGDRTMVTVATRGHG